MPDASRLVSKDEKQDGIPKQPSAHIVTSQTSQEPQVSCVHTVSTISPYQLYPNFNILLEVDTCGSTPPSARYDIYCNYKGRFSESSGGMGAVEEIGDQREWVVVLPCDVIKSAVIYHPR